jgi:hypothetical protein
MRWWNFGDGLDVEGIHGDATLGNDEPKEVSGGDAKYTLRGFKRILY